ncbi:MAG: 50S ribosomal protein L24 [Planctomycetota bacterium]|nr:50S ribosomal protein L24 [Planctomycetota bacterium]MDA1215147.1 50S ribosomal protein L24 [Planctomycetota bacterium]
MKIQRGDTVIVTTGDDAGTTPRKVLQVLDDGQRVVVEGVNRVYKHVKRGHPKSPQGGRLQLEMSIAISNVRLHCNACGKGVRVGYRYAADGSKERFCKACDAAVNKVSPAKTTYQK